MRLGWGRRCVTCCGLLGARYHLRAMSAFSKPSAPVPALPPTSADLVRDDTRPYFLWWTDATVADLRAHLADPNPEVRAYWMGALLREANTRDVWLYVGADDIRALWPRLLRHLGRSREMWAYLLELPRPLWPPRLEPGDDKAA
jgi:hypothetical protein